MSGTHPIQPRGSSLLPLPLRERAGVRVRLATTTKQAPKPSSLARPTRPPTPSLKGRGSKRLRPAARQRGSVYLLVLGVCSIILVIGLSAMAAVRIQHRGTILREDAAQAQQLADAGLQIVFARLTADPDWRTNETHDAWSTLETTGAGFFQYKLVDQNDTDLSDDDNDPARLYIRATHGDAVRLASVQLRLIPPRFGPELITNGDMEAGTSSHEASVIFGGTLAAYTDNPHSGATYIQLENRPTVFSTLTHQITPSAVTSDQTYRISAWMKTEDTDEEGKLGIAYSVNNIIHLSDDQTVNLTTSWQHYEIDVTPSFLASLLYCTFYASSSETRQDTHFDDLSMRAILAPSSLAIVRGSYRRELDE